MDIERFCVKFPALSGQALDDGLYIDIFHEWIREKKLDGTLLDVADYRHVPDGPGVMLLTHNINFSMDYSGGQFGLLAQRKRGQTTTPVERILELIGATITFGALLEADLRLDGELRLNAGAFHYLANDRLLAPNTDAAYATLEPDLAAAAALIYPGRDISIQRVANDPRDRLTIAVEVGSLTMTELMTEHSVEA